MRFTMFVLGWALLGLFNTGCGDAPCTGAGCKVDVKAPSDATTTADTNWATVKTTKDCANNGGVVEADNPGLDYAQQTASVMIHMPAAVGVSMHVNMPILVWRAACNKSNGHTGAQTVTWTRASCTTANDCPAPTTLATSTVTQQDACACQPVYVQDQVSTPGLYDYALSFNGQRLAHAVVRVEQ